MEKSAHQSRGVKRFVGLAVLVVGSLALAAGLAEILIRVLVPQNLILIRPDVWIPHERYSWTTASNLDVALSAGETPIRFVTDANGNRIGRDGVREAKVRILALGDSFLQAVEVEYEQTLGALLEERMTHELERTVAVVNAGVSGWGTNKYRLKIDDELSVRQYDLVVVFLHQANDVTGRRITKFEPRAPTVQHEFRMPENASRVEIVSALLYPINDLLERRSHLFTLVKDRGLLFRMRFGLTSIRMPEVLDRKSRLWSGWAVTADILAEMQRVAVRNKVGFVVVLLPGIHEVDSEFVDRYIRALGLNTAQYDRDQPSREMVRALERRSVPVVDPTAALRAASATGGPRLFDRVTIHYSPRGHRVTADAVAPALTALLAGERDPVHDRTPRE